jgi:hypothetical protein
MTLRDVVSACCGIIFVWLVPAQAFGAVECATEAQRKIEIEKLNESVDWFLSIVEEVPEGIARQFKTSLSIGSATTRHSVRQLLIPYGRHTRSEWLALASRMNFVLGHPRQKPISSGRSGRCGTALRLVFN